MIPLELWNPSPRDLASFFAETFYRQVVSVLAQMNITVSLSVPDDRVLILGAVIADIQAGIGQTVNPGPDGINISIDPVGTPTLVVMRPDTNSVANVRHLISFIPDHLWVPPSSILRTQALFNAAVAVNTVRMNVLGYTIPRGNIAQA